MTERFEGAVPDDGWKQPQRRPRNCRVARIYDDVDSTPSQLWTQKVVKGHGAAQRSSERILCLVHTADCRHRQDKIALSCHVGVRSMNCIDYKSRLVHTCVHTADETGQNCSVCNILTTTQFTPPTPTRRDSLVLSVSAV